MTDASRDELLELAFEFCPASMVAVDAAGTIVLVNRQTERLFGYTRDELLGQPVERLVPPRFRDAHVGHREAFTAAPESRPMGAGRELFGLRKDGTEIPVEIGLTTAETRSGPVVLASIIDIGARRALEERVRQTEKLHTIGTLAAGIAHDFNNLLRAILGHTELALASLPERTPAADDLAQAMAAARRGQRIVERILAFGRSSESGHVPVTVDRIVGEAIELLRASLPHTIDVRSRVDPDTPRVAATETELHQVLMNLASNAVQAMSAAGGVLEVIAAPFRGDTAFARAHPTLAGRLCVHLRVADTGPGMPPEVVERAFEPFFTTKGPDTGTGLGLPVVRGIVEAYGGAVELHSRAGEGTAVDIYLPAVETAAAAAPSSGARRPSVLLVDDEPAIAALGRRQLEAAGFRVSVHTSSLGALEDFRINPEEYTTSSSPTAPCRGCPARCSPPRSGRSARRPESSWYRGWVTPRRLPLAPPAPSPCSANRTLAASSRLPCVPSRGRNSHAGNPPHRSCCPDLRPCRDLDVPDDRGRGAGRDGIGHPSARLR